MKQSRKRKGGVKDSSKKKKTNQKLEEELIEAQEAAEKREAELTKCKIQLRKIKDELGPLDELRVKLNLAEEVGKKLRASEKHKKKLQKRIQELEEIIDALNSKFESEQHWDVDVSKNILPPKSSYRIDLYRHQGPDVAPPHKSGHQRCYGIGR